MFGNWAMGRVSIETTPTNTIMMAMTMATMGRLMKNRYIIASGRRIYGRDLPGAGLVGCWVVGWCWSDERLRIHRHALLRFLDSFGNDALTGLKSLLDDPVRPDL